MKENKSLEDVCREFDLSLLDNISYDVESVASDNFILTGSFYRNSSDKLREISDEEINDKYHKFFSNTNQQ